MQSLSSSPHSPLKPLDTLSDEAEIYSSYLPSIEELLTSLKITQGNCENLSELFIYLGILAPSLAKELVEKLIMHLIGGVSVEYALARISHR